MPSILFWRDIIHVTHLTTHYICFVSYLTQLKKKLVSYLKSKEVLPRCCPVEKRRYLKQLHNKKKDRLYYDSSVQGYSVIIYTIIK